MNKQTINIFWIGLVIALLLLIDVSLLEAQCPMCKMSAEADLDNGGTTAQGLNKGIMYLLLFPYVLVGGLGFIWWRHQKRVAEAEQELELRALLEAHDISFEKEEIDEMNA